MHGLDPGSLIYSLTAIGGCVLVGFQTNSKRVWAENPVYGGVDHNSVLTGVNANFAKMRTLKIDYNYS